MNLKLIFLACDLHRLMYMQKINLLILCVLSLNSFSLVFALEKNLVSHSSEIKNYDYVCLHTQKPEALVFKISEPQQIWRTTLNKHGQIKTKNAFYLDNVKINPEPLNTTGQVSSFKALLTKNYEIKGLFKKDLENEIPLTVISTYTPESAKNKLIETYNCQTRLESSTIQLGSNLKD